MIPIQRAISLYRQEGLSRLLRGARDWAGLGLVKRIQGPKEGVDIVKEDWDNLIVLDACRYDVFEAVSDLPGDLERRTSRAAVTWSFLEQNFAGRELHDTVYVAANAVVGTNAERLDVYKLVGLWNEIQQGDHDDVVNPETVVEETLTLADEHRDKRLIAHFLQPHTPFVRRNGERILPDSPYRDYKAARDGDASEDEIRDVYNENVVHVVDHVSDLIKELDGKTVVTADHGELLGEGVGTLTKVLHPRWPVTERRNFDYGHYSNIRKPELVEVPWLVIENETRRETVAETPAGVKMESRDLEKHLDALGYKT
jgi:hypothetical protein